MNQTLLKAPNYLTCHALHRSSAIRLLCTASRKVPSNLKNERGWDEGGFTLPLPDIASFSLNTGTTDMDSRSSAVAARFCRKVGSWKSLEVTSTCSPGETGGKLCIRSRTSGRVQRDRDCRTSDAGSKHRQRGEILVSSHPSPFLQVLLQRELKGPQRRRQIHSCITLSQSQCFV